MPLFERREELHCKGNYLSKTTQESPASSSPRRGPRYVSLRFSISRFAIFVCIILKIIKSELGARAGAASHGTAVRPPDGLRVSPGLDSL